MKVVTIVGTRPELIKLSEIIKKLDEFTEHIFIHTGQNYDPRLNDIFYKDLDLREPDYYLYASHTTLGQTIGDIMSKVEQVLVEEKPDAVVILGDTNSALSGIIAKRMKLPLFHLEAGNRCFDDNVPEEINRRILDHISDVNMVYTDIQKHNLLAEGIARDRLFIMGSPMKEILSTHFKSILESKILKTLNITKNEYFLVSLHRDENIEIPGNLEILIGALYKIIEKYDLPIVITTHPRLRKRLGEFEIYQKMLFEEPFGFVDYNHLQMNAKCVISDSGTIAEESAILGFPAVTIRNAFERPEAIDAGSILMSGVNEQNILDCIELARKPAMIPAEYSEYNCSDRVLNAIISYTPYINRYVWHK